MGYILLESMRFFGMRQFVSIAFYSAINNILANEMVNCLRWMDYVC
jgi:hypothetical protein